MKKVFFLLFLQTASLLGGLTLYNDSPFPLVAKVLSANGDLMAEKEVPRGERVYIEDQIGFSDPVGRGKEEEFDNPEGSMTPYQVFWYCKEGGVYSSCLDAGVGATVTPNTCPGNHGCFPLK